MKKAAETLRVWMVDYPINRCLSCLTAALADLPTDELRRAEAYLHEPAREAFIYRRSALRRILGGVTGESPPALRFRQDCFGKPTLVYPCKTTLLFNQAGSRLRTLIVVSGELPIGVDIEEIRPDCIDGRVARRWFPPAWLESVPRADFLTLWTRAEAILKADGRGLSALPQLQKLSTEFLTVDLPVGTQHRAALAVPGARMPKVDFRTVAFADLLSIRQDDLNGVAAAH